MKYWNDIEERIEGSQKDFMESILVKICNSFFFISIFGIKKPLCL